MFKSLRVPERLFQLVMWVVSVAFAGFLIGLGGKIVGDLPGVDQTVQLESFVDNAAMLRVRQSRTELEESQRVSTSNRDDARLALTAAQNAWASAKDKFDAWIATRNATVDPTQDPEVIRRTRELDILKGAERDAQQRVETLDSTLLSISQRFDSLTSRANELEDAARPQFERAYFWQELKVFGIRLAITLPLLVIAAWLVARKRKSDYWPLGRGFVLFALFAFFVELVPYLPSYGGYVRYGVGVIGTFVAGLYVIRAMRRYLARRQQAEQQPDAERRRTLGYEDAIRKMQSGMCPACERPIAGAPQNPSNFCVHCGLNLFDTCGSCNTRKNAFYQYCPICGATTDAKTGTAHPAATPGSLVTAPTLTG